MLKNTSNKHVYWFCFYITLIQNILFSFASMYSFKVVNWSTQSKCGVHLELNKKTKKIPYRYYKLLYCTKLAWLCILWLCVAFERLWQNMSCSVTLSAPMFEFTNPTLTLCVVANVGMERDHEIVRALRCSFSMSITGR